MQKLRRLAAGATGLALAVLLGACAATADEGANETPADLTQLSDESFPATDPAKSPANANRRTDTFVSVIRKPGGVFLPGFYDNGWDGNASAPIFAALVVLDDAGQPIGDLAESWEISPDNLTYTYKLRDGLKWADGSKLTAEDIAFTLKLYNDPAYAGGLDFTKIVIAGTEEFKNGDADELSGLKVVDERTIEITTEKPNPLALTTLGGQVLPKAYYGKDYAKGKLDYLKPLYGKPLGSGPYQLDTYVEGQEVRYKANENYYGGRPEIDRYILKVLTMDATLQNFQNGDIDQSGFGSDPAILDELKALEFANIYTYVVADIGIIFTNNKKPALADTNVRKALIYGLDRQQVVDAKYKGLGQVADVFAAPPLWSFTTEGVTKYPFDPDQANQLLDAAGWAKGADGVRAKDGQKLTLSYITTDAKDPVIPIGEQNYTALGIDFVPEVLDSNTAFARYNGGDYDLAAFRTAGLDDPNDAVARFGTDDPAINLTGYSNPEVERLVAEGVATFDPAERKRIYAELYAVLSEDPPSIPVDYRKLITGTNARIEGGAGFTNGASDAAIKVAKLKIKSS